MRFPWEVPAALLLLPGCATGAAFSVPTARVGEEGPGLSWFVEGKESAVPEGLLPGLRGLPADLGPRPRSALLPGKCGRHAVVVDASDPARPPRMWMDLAGSGDFTGVEPTAGDWYEGRTAYVSQDPTLRLPAPGGGHREYPLSIQYHGEAEGPGTMEVVSMDWLRGKVTLGGREFEFALRDLDADGDYADPAGLTLVFDQDGDRYLDAGQESGEGYRGDERFNLGTGTFRVARVAEDGSEVSFEPAWPPASVRPFLGVGDPAPPIPATDLDGKPISLEEFRGRKVLLVFWAEW